MLDIFYILQNVKYIFWQRKHPARSSKLPQAGLNLLVQVWKSLIMQSLDNSMQVRIPVKLYRIGEIVHHSPFSRQTIHNYTTMGLIQESDWTEGGHRLYDESVFARLSKILELRRTKTLAEIRKIFQSEDVLVRS